MLVGVGESSTISSVSVRWPSGKTQWVENIVANQLLSIYENSLSSPDGNAYTLGAYKSFDSISSRTVENEQGKFNFNFYHENDKSELRVLVSMATWCDSCKNHIPQIEKLKASLHGDSISFYGLPADIADTKDKLNTYSKENQLSYSLLSDLKTTDRISATQFLEKRTGLTNVTKHHRCRSQRQPN